MSEILYKLVAWVAAVHDRILTLNDQSGTFMTDKQLHFIVMGIVGIIIFAISYFIFKLLKEHLLIIAFIYSFTVMTVITFAIEIGQGITGTGSPEMKDVTAGMAGFLCAALLFVMLRAVVRAIIKLFR